MGSMVDETIAFIQDQQNNASGGIGIAGEQMRLDKLQVLEGADLRQLESYLKVNDEGRILGNLYRTVTPEGNVKWVCIDHYRENYRASATEQLRDIVVGNGGKFMENIGKVSVNVASSTQARQLYEAITKARGIQELEIALQWDVTLDDLRTFEAAISKANIVTLTMDGAYFKGPAFDIINRGRRYDPILQLMSNGRIQCLRLNQFDQFCLHVNTSSIALAPQLRILVIDLAISLYEKNAQAAFTKILESCPSLTGLRVNSYHQYLVYEIAVGKIEHFRDLRRLTITCGGHTWKANLTQGEIHNAAMTINRLEDVSTDEVRLFQLGQLRTLSIRRTPTEAEASRLTDILRQNPGLLELHIGCHVERSLSLINLVTATRQSMISEDRPCELRRLDLRKDSGDSEADLGKNDVVNSTVEFVDASTSTAPRISTSVSMSRTTRKDEFGGFEDFLREFAWTIEKLETDSTFDDRLATLLDRSTEELGSRLKSLVLLPRNLSSEGLDSVDSVIERSQNLEILQILHHGMKSEEQQQKAERLIRRHGHRLDTLLLSGFAADVWMTRLSAAFPTRRDLPVLTSFRVFCFGKQKLPHHCAQWIAAMASGPSQGVLSVPSPLDPSPQDAFISISQQVAEEVSEAWTPLKELILVCLTIQSEDWKTILEGLDFSALEVLHVTNSNFSLSELKVLVRRISESPEIEVPLRSLRLEKTSISKCDDVDVVRELVEALKKKAPLVKVEGLPLL
ncbi:hypothetical protein BC939DRAFT_454023, partial [Gamsiella multidivaricata]|uniref:uncharacterized protein n=1 Tax=Gamsiella multidivaricata TaxID=101098 RepID=UPI002220890E